MQGIPPLQLPAAKWKKYKIWILNKTDSEIGKAYFKGWTSKTCSSFSYHNSEYKLSEFILDLKYIFKKIL